MLTPRQLEVCVALVELERDRGHATDKAIAARVGLSPRVVRFHMERAAVRLRLADAAIPNVSPRRVIALYFRNRLADLAERRAAEILHPRKAA